MDWSPKQEAALRAVGEWLPTARESGRQVFRLFGYAGTGKTTLARHFAEGVGSVLFAAYTGKAASVMRKNGCHAAKTIHQLIYKPAPKSAQRLLELREHLAKLKAEKGPEEEIQKTLTEMRDVEKDLKRPAFVLNFDSEVQDVGLIIVDECSMVGEEMGRDLLSFGTPVLVLGDPAQLPPVAAGGNGGGYFTNAEPDILLTEIHRQAADSPIIRMATDVRTGKWLAFGNYGDSRVVRRVELDPHDVIHHDQILVGKNDTRKSCNVRTRELLGRVSHLPERGDKLVCLKNNHDLGLLNGTTWINDEAVILNDDAVTLKIQPEEAHESGLMQWWTVVAHRHPFEGREISYWEKRAAEEFDFGYALTTHKAQGSQWDSVIVFDEAYCFRQDRQKWLYTAITRAADRVTVAR